MRFLQRWGRKQHGKSRKCFFSQVVKNTDCLVKGKSEILLLWNACYLDTNKLTILQESFERSRSMYEKKNSLTILLKLKYNYSALTLYLRC